MATSYMEASFTLYSIDGTLHKSPGASEVTRNYWLLVSACYRKDNIGYKQSIRRMFTILIWDDRNEEFEKDIRNAPCS